MWLGRVTKFPFVDFSVKEIFDSAKARVRIFKSHTYFIDATAAKLRRHRSNMNIKFDSYLVFDNSKNRDINGTKEIGLVTPTPGRLTTANNGKCNFWKFDNYGTAFDHFQLQHFIICSKCCVILIKQILILRFQPRLWHHRLPNVTTAERNAAGVLVTFDSLWCCSHGLNLSTNSFNQNDIGMICELDKYVTYRFIYLSISAKDLWTWHGKTKMPDISSSLGLEYLIVV